MGVVNTAHLVTGVSSQEAVGWPEGHLASHLVSEDPKDLSHIPGFAQEIMLYSQHLKGPLVPKYISVFIFKLVLVIILLNCTHLTSFLINF